MTTDERLDALERELGREKRVNRILLTVLGVTAVATVTGLSVTGQGKLVPPDVRVRAVIIEDATGKARAILGVTANGPDLRMFDAAGNVRAQLTILGGDSPALNLSDRNGKVRAILGVQDAGRPALDLLDAEGKIFWTTPAKRTP